jgi:hypothetical protein
LKDIIKKYLAKREEALRVSVILLAGDVLIYGAENMGRNRRFKATEYEISDLVDKCLRMRNALVEEIDKFKYNIPAELASQIKNLEINKLIDCRKLGELYLEAGKIIENQSGCSSISIMFLAPIKYNAIMSPHAPIISIPFNLLECFCIFALIALFLFLKITT